MGRSGTSAVTSMFAAAGFYAGDESSLMPAMPDNPRGYFENLGVYHLNEEILADMGASWFDPPPPSRLRHEAPQLTPRISGLLDRLVGEADGRPVAIKDPRIGVLLPLWGAAIERHLHPVLVLRDPLEVALSLKTREEMPLAFGLAAWELHHIRELSYLDGRTVTVIPSRLIITDPDVGARLVADASAHLAAHLRARVDPTGATRQLERSLRHHEVDPRQHDRHLTLFQARLWEWLSRLPPGTQRMQVPEMLLVNEGPAEGYVREESARKSAAAGERDLLERHQSQLSEAAQARELLHQQLGEQQRELDSARRELASTSGELDSARRKLASASGELDSARRELALASGELEIARRAVRDVMESRSWRLTGPLRQIGGSLRRPAASPAGVEGRDDAE